MYKFFIFQLDQGKSEFLTKDKTDNIILSSTINQPLISLGFHYFLNRTKSAMVITNNLETKNEFYYVVNPFEPIISNYEDSLVNLTKQYLNNNNDITSHNFYKLWEIMYLFDLTNIKEISCAVISNNPKIYIQSVQKFREKLTNSSKKDEYKSINISNDKDKDDYDSMNDYNNYVNKKKEYVNLIISDCNKSNIDNIFEEQESYDILLEQIITAISSQDKDGNLVLKVLETFTIPTIKLIYILSSFYKETYIYKPFLSRVTNSEKYLICKGFLYNHSKDNDVLNKKIKSLEKTLKDMDNNKFVHDIYPDIDFPSNYLNKFKFINIKICNPQQIIINKIVTFIKQNNYYGEDYHMYRDKQIEATKWWISSFYPPSNNLYQKNKDELQKILLNNKNNYESEFENFSNSLIK